MPHTASSFEALLVSRPTLPHLVFETHWTVRLVCFPAVALVVLFDMSTSIVARLRRWSHTDRRYYSKCDDASASQLAQLQPRSQLLAHSLPAVTSSVSVGQYQLAVRPRCHQRFRACKSLALGSSMGLLIRTSYLPSKPPRRSRACRHNSQSPRGQNGSASERRNSVKGEAARRGQSALGLACSSLCGHPPLQRPTRLLLSDLC